MTARGRQVAALTIVGALVMSLGLTAPAHGESATPTATPSTAGASGSGTGAPETVDTYVGQSLQVRKDADGNPNSAFVDYRWAATQVNAESLKGVNAAVPLPMPDTPMLRSLIGSDYEPTKTTDGLIYSFSDVDGVDVYRTVNLWPEDEATPVDVTAEFTLNGMPVKAQDIVGEGGVVTAVYTVKNNTRQKTSVTFTGVNGKEQTRTVETDQPMMAMASALFPQGWAQFDAHGGTVGADGRGQYQTQWIALPFAPLSKSGSAQFGWSAVVPDGEGFIPQVVVEVAPIYLPEAGERSGEQAAARPGIALPSLPSLPGIPHLQGAGSGNGARGITPPNFADGVASAREGVTRMVAGISSVADIIAGARSETQDRLKQAMADTQAAMQRLCLLIDCRAQRQPLNITGVISQLNILSARLTTAITQVSTSGANVDRLVAKLREADSRLAASTTKAQKALATARAVAKAECGDGPLADPDNCTKATEAIGALQLVIALLGAGSSRIERAIAQLPSAVGQIEVRALTSLKVTVDGLVGKLTTVQQKLVAVKAAVNDLKSAMAEFGAAIRGGIASLGGMEASLQEISAGKAQVSAGLGDVGQEAKTYLGSIAELAATAKSRLVKLVKTLKVKIKGKVRVLKGTIAEKVAAAKGKAVTIKQKITDMGKKADALKAEAAGLMVRARQSPLPYGGGTETVYATPDSGVSVQQVSEAVLAAGDEPVAKYAKNLQPSTKVFGAYQFVLDPATADQTQTGGRIVVSVLLLLVAGLGLSFVRRRRVAVRGG